ncbi:MAG: hypothetical protein IJH64_12320 [Oscillospiraceae bacterium]|nr:hypothetical protein [Oscillospiraceae bacterium]
MSRKIIGLTGAFGSGTTFISEQFFVPKGYKKCSLSQVLKEEYKTRKGSAYNSRQELQDFGNELRQGEPSILARLIDEGIISKDDESNFVIESIRNPAEIQYFRERYPEFVLIGIFADYEIRWERVKDVYHNSKDTFDKDEQKDKGTFEPKYGQKISDCFFESDLILSNNVFINGTNDAYKDMDRKIDGYLIALDDPANSNPTLKETLMAAAYTSGRRSKCFKRKVGAIIADKYDRIISSGFNGVPKGLQECKPLFGECYRDIKRKNIAEKICSDIDLETDDSDRFEDVVKKNVKLLELCRALHGEESAIMNLVGRSADLDCSTIYVTTYPCNLCANKIVQSGIKNVVYFEPYPVEEAKKIFKEARIKTEPFEGVTFRAFFRFFQFEP